MKGKIIVIAFEFTDIMGVVGEGCCADYHRGPCTHGKDDQALLFSGITKRSHRTCVVSMRNHRRENGSLSKINYFITF
ncbi:hypothetical protein Gotur_000025 [Gossypium turneri]